MMRSDEMYNILGEIDFSIFVTKYWNTYLLPLQNKYLETRTNEDKDSYYNKRLLFRRWLYVGELIDYFSEEFDAPVREQRKKKFNVR